MPVFREARLKQSKKAETIGKKQTEQTERTVPKKAQLEILDNCAEMGIAPKTKWRNMTTEQQEILKSKAIASDFDYLDELADIVDTNAEIAENKEKIIERAKSRNQALLQVLKEIDNDFSEARKHLADEREKRRNSERRVYNFDDVQDMLDFCRMVAYCRTKYVADKVDGQQIAKNLSGNGIVGGNSKLTYIKTYICTAKFEDYYDDTDGKDTDEIKNRAKNPEKDIHL